MIIFLLVDKNLDNKEEAEKKFKEIGEVKMLNIIMI
jgi:hypothetical protein